MCGFPSSAYPFFLLGYFVFMAFCVFFGQCMAGLMPNIMAGQILVPLIQTLWNLSNGFLIPKSEMPAYWSIFNIGEFRCTPEEFVPITSPPLVNGHPNPLCHRHIKR
eukprot:gene16782-60516_t